MLTIFNQYIDGRDKMDIVNAVSCFLVTTKDTKLYAWTVSNITFYYK